MTAGLLGNVERMGFGAMQLAGPGAFGPPRDREGALRVLRRAVELGVDHLDTPQCYGPDVVNALIREALHPYPGLSLVSKVGARRDETGAGCRGTPRPSCGRASRTTSAPWTSSSSRPSTCR